MMKKFLIIPFLLILLLTCGYKKPYKYTIAAEKDAFFHNNVGINYLSLSPSTQASAIFYNNLGETYNFIGYPDLAKDCFENSIKLYGLNLQYHLNLVNCYIRLNLAQAKINEFKASENVYDKIKLGLLYIETGEVRKGVNTLDEICMQEPDLIITSALKQYLKKVIKEKL